MLINAFFEHRLQAKFHHSRMSWGAVNSVTGFVFLRVGIWSVYDEQDGSEWALICQPKWDNDYGQTERAGHIELIESGTPAYIVLVENRGSKTNLIVNEQVLRRVGALVWEGKKLYAKLGESVPTEDVVNQIDAAETRAGDILGILRETKKETTRIAQIETRVGQGEFRRRVLNMWSYRCAVTGCRTNRAIRASHIVPWKDASPAERLDPYNGLPLVGTLDALFDAHLISFSRSGQIIISESLPIAEQTRLGIHPKMTIGKLSAKMERYMTRHRKLLG